jgi:hypothetical protein
VSITITRYRGDTAPDQFTITRDGVAVDITGYAFKLTVNSNDDPTDTADQLYSLTGSITDAAAGYVEFAPTAMEADQTPGEYYYDVQQTDDLGAILTVAKGRYRYKQDITKS